MSGANCAIVVAFAVLILAWLGAGRSIRVVGALLVLAAFVVLVTPQASVVRASIMASVALIVQLTGRPSGGIPVLAGSVVLMLTVDPWYAFNAGFALSVLATGGLLLGTRPLASALGRILPHGLALVIAVPLAAQLACQPVLVLLSHTISVYGVAANILAAPAAPLGTVVGLIACLIAGLLPPIAMLLAWLAYLPSAWIAGVAMVTSNLPASLVPWIPGPPGALLLAGVTAIAWSIAVLPRWRSHWSGRAAIAALCVALGVYGGVVTAPALTEALSKPRDWNIAACDVGQGDALVLRAGGGVILVDTGPEPELVTDCLDTLGITSIDLLVLTHYDSDHAGGVAGAIDRTERAFVQAVHDDAGDKTTRLLRDAGVAVETVTAGVRGAIGGIEYSVIWPPTPEFTGNAGSLVLDVAIRGVRVVLLGDLGEDQQRALLADRPSRWNAGIVKVAHHGSADQSAEMYQQLGASIAVVSVGAENTYGHPNDQTVRELMAAGSRVLRTDRRGLILIAIRTEAFTVWSQKPVDVGAGR